MSRITNIIKGVIIAVVIVYGAWIAFKWTAMRVYVGPHQGLIVINKFGRSLPGDLVVVPADDNGYKGVQEEVRGPGRYFLDPIRFDAQQVDLKEISAGDPQRWEWTEEGVLKDPSTAPQIGIVSAKQGKTAVISSEIVDVGYKGIQREVLTPGTYKINPYLYDVMIERAVIVPPGSVGVVTRLVGDIGQVSSATLTQIRQHTIGPATQPGQESTAPDAPTRLVVGPTQRGILKDVLQPGIYYLNPRMVKVTIVPVGYDAVTLDEENRKAIRFYSNDGYLVEADFTVVWGRAPADAPHIIANIGSAQKVEQNVIEPAMKAACQNEGAKYTAKELIQGSTRSKFQDDLSKSLEDQVKSRNIHVLLALIRNIAIKDNAGKDQTMGLLATIQQANIEIERDLTNKQKTETATVQASLEQAKKLVDVARETVASESNVKVANILADGQKKAAEIDAQRELEVAQIENEIAKLDAQRTEILGKADADVARLKNEAEAKGAKMLVDALGSPAAYNNYIFAKSFEPTDLKLIFAGPGTFWTDLKSFQDVGASNVIQQSQQSPQSPQSERRGNDSR